MTASEAERIFYETYGAGAWSVVGGPLVQSELRAKCWEAVIAAVQKECSSELGRAVLAAIENDGKWPVKNNE